MNTTYANLLPRLHGAALCLALCAALAAPATALAGGRFGGPGGDLFRIERMMEELDLSDAQRSAVERIMADGRAAMQPLVRQLVSGREALRELVEAEVFDETAVRALAAEHSALRTEMMVLKARNRHAVRQVLTPEQRERFGRCHQRQSPGA